MKVMKTSPASKLAKRRKKAKTTDAILTPEVVDSSVKTVKFDIAAGQNKVAPDFIGVDIFEGADIVADLFKFPYTFAEDNSVDEIHCSHFIEHLPMEYVTVNGKPKDMLFAFLDEIHRMLKPGGFARLIFPCATSTRAFQDPTHRRFIPAQTAYYTQKAWREANKLDHYNVDCDFDWQVGEAVNPNWQGRSQDAKLFAGQNYWNVVDDLHFILTKKKPTNK